MVSYTKQKKTVIIFYKALLVGTVKTRLGSILGDVNALACYRCMLEYFEQELKEYSVVHAINETAPDTLCYWKPDMIQQGNSLALRMRNAFREILSMDTHKTLLIGSDILYLQKDDIESAFHALDDADICIFPSSDGGYSLIGMKNHHYDIFTDTPIIPPTSPYQSVLQSAKSVYKVHKGRIIDDIDTEEDLQDFLRSKNKTKTQESLSRSLAEQISKTL